MAVVLDSSIPLAVAMKNKKCTDAFDRLSGSGYCYMTIASVEEYVSQIKADCSTQLAEKWIGWLFTNGDIKIAETTSQDYFTEDFVSSVGDAYNLSRLGVPPASAAALARALGVPVVVSSLRPRFRQLELERFCEVIWIDPE